MGEKYTKQTQPPLEVMGLTDAFRGWRGGSLEDKKQMIIARAVTMPGSILPMNLARTAYHQMAEMDKWNLLNIMSRGSCVYFLHRQQHSPKKCRFETERNGTNFKYEVRLRITSPNDTGILGSPENYMAKYQEAVSALLKCNKHSFELIYPSQQHIRLNLRRNGIFTTNTLERHIPQWRGPSNRLM